MRNWTILLGVSLVGVSAADLSAAAMTRTEPDPVHSRTIKREVRKQQRQQAKRLARMQKGSK